MESVKEGIRRNLMELMAVSDTRNIDLADACGVGKSAVSNWLAGKSSIDIERIPLICDFFGISVDEFFGRAKHMEPSASLTADELALLETYRAASPIARKAMLATVGALADNIGEGVGFSDAQVTVRTA